MRSILLVTIEYPPQLGGIATYLAHMAENLPGGDISVLAPDMPETHKIDMASPVPIYRRPLLWRFLRPRWMPALYWTLRYCRRDRPDMVVVSHLLNMGKVALATKRLTGTPYAVVLHGFDVAQARSTTFFKSLAAKEILRNADLVIANSGFTASFAKSFGVRDDRMALVNPPPWLSLDESADKTDVARFRKNHGLGDRFTLLTVSRLMKRKGLDTVIDAVAELRRAGREVEYVIIGDGPDRGRLKHRAERAGVLEHVKFLGAMEPDTLAVPYTACDAFVMVPRSEKGGDIEGYGIVYLEANIFGKPVIGSRAGGVPEAVLHGETGLLVKPDDVRQLVMAVEALMDDPKLCERLGQGGRDRLRRDYGDNRQARRFLAAVRRATGKSREYAE